MARSMFSLGMFSFLAAATAVRRRGFAIASPPPTRAAIVISRISLVNTRPRLASVAAFLCLMVAHLECPDMGPPHLARICRCVAHCGGAPATPGLFCHNLAQAPSQRDPPNDIAVSRVAFDTKHIPHTI